MDDPENNAKKSTAMSCRYVIVMMISVCCLGCLRTIDTTAKIPPAVSSLDAEIASTLEHVLKKRMLSTEVHAAWQVLHGVLAYGNEFPVQTSDGKQSALQYLLDGGSLNGWTFESGDSFADGRNGLRAIMEPGGYAGQGHADQWLAVLAQSNLELGQEIRIGSKIYLISDFLAQVKNDVPYNVESEWSWTLIGLTWYLPTSSTWTAGDGNQWSIEELVRRELQQEIQSSTCGGTHRLIGLSMALNKHRADGGEMTPLWQDVERTLKAAADTAQQFRNVDGSLSSNYFSRPGIPADSAKMLATTGHTLEFLAITLPKDRLREPWVEAAVVRLCNLLNDATEVPLECGGLYHAVHGLVVYQDRAFGEPDPSANANAN